MKYTSTSSLSTKTETKDIKPPAAVWSDAIVKISISAMSKSRRCPKRFTSECTGIFIAPQIILTSFQPIRQLENMDIESVLASASFNSNWSEIQPEEIFACEIMQEIRKIDSEMDVFDVKTEDGVGGQWHTVHDFALLKTKDYISKNFFLLPTSDYMTLNEAPTVFLCGYPIADKPCPDLTSTTFNHFVGRICSSGELMGAISSPFFSVAVSCNLGMSGGPLIATDRPEFLGILCGQCLYGSGHVFLSACHPGFVDVYREFVAPTLPFERQASAMAFCARFELPIPTALEG